MKLLNFFKKFLSKPSALLGLTLDKTSLRLVELGKAGDDYLLRHCSQTPLPSIDSSDSSQDFSFTHPQFSDFLKQTIQKFNITTQQVVLALPYSSVLFKTIEVDKNLSEAEIAIQVHAHARQYFNYPLSELMMDFELLGTSKNHTGLREVRWVAARRLEIETQLNALSVAGLSVAAVEIDSFSLQRVAAYYLKRKGMQLERVAVVQIYPSHILFIVLYQGICVFTRIETYTSDSSENLNDVILKAIIVVAQLSTANEIDSELSLILLAGHVISADFLNKIQNEFNIPVHYLDVFSLLNFFTPHAPHEFSISTGLAMRVIL